MLEKRRDERRAGGDRRSPGKCPAFPAVREQVAPLPRAAGGIKGKTERFGKRFRLGKVLT